MKEQPFRSNHITNQIAKDSNKDNKIETVEDYCYECDGSGYAETGWQTDDGDEVVETCYECDGDGNVDEGGK